MFEFNVPETIKKQWDYKKTLSLEPTAPNKKIKSEIFRQLGLITFLFEAKTKIISHCLDLLSFPSDAAFAHYYLAYIYFSQKNYELSLDHLFQAAQIPLEKADQENLQYIESACLILESYYFTVQKNPATALAYYGKAILVGSSNTLYPLVADESPIKKYNYKENHLLINFFLAFIFNNDETRATIKTHYGSLAQARARSAQLQKVKRNLVWQASASNQNERDEWFFMPEKTPIASQTESQLHELSNLDAKTAKLLFIQAVQAIVQEPAQKHESFIRLTFELMRLNLLNILLDDSLLQDFLEDVSNHFQSNNSLSKNYILNLKLYFACKTNDFKLAQETIAQIDEDFTQLWLPDLPIAKQLGFKRATAANDYETAFSFLKQLNDFNKDTGELISFLRDLLASNDLETIRLALNLISEKKQQIAFQLDPLKDTSTEVQNTSPQSSNQNNNNAQTPIITNPGIDKEQLTQLHEELTLLEENSNPVFVFKAITLFSIYDIKEKAQALLPKKQSWLSLFKNNEKQNFADLHLDEFQSSLQELSYLEKEKLLQPLLLPTPSNGYKCTDPSGVAYNLEDYKSTLKFVSSTFNALEISCQKVIRAMNERGDIEGSRQWSELSLNITKVLSDLKSIETDLETFIGESIASHQTPSPQS
jgi:hypothetical protein